ncbi:hypothetical protein HDG38_006176 [Paraburkholderia sp. WSM4177]|nr:hypothetical protein [Paraburkholderia sp. WSM4177]MBB5488040.1 hypothetical protein [Paraburkholderia sp. WSM4180]
MKRFVEGGDRGQAVLLPEYLDDYVADDNTGPCSVTFKPLPLLSVYTASKASVTAFTGLSRAATLAISMRE